MRQESFSTLFGQRYETAAAAKAARDARYRKLKAQGFNVRRSILKNQLRQYWSMGIPCGETCDVYKLDFDNNPDT